MKWILIIVAALLLIVAVVALTGMMLRRPISHPALPDSNNRPQAIWDAITGPPNWRPDVRAFENLPPRDDIDRGLKPISTARP